MPTDRKFKFRRLPDIGRGGALQRVWSLIDAYEVIRGLTGNRRIIDDEFEHELVVFQDKESRALRLHASVWKGELHRCPVWTAFGRHNHNRIS